MANSTPRPGNRYCSGCGKPGPFANETVLKCNRCAKKAEADRKQYQRDYQHAKSDAIRELIEAHQEEFDGMLFRARVRVQREREKG